MRALVVTAPRRAEVQEVAAPAAAPGRLVVEVERAGICGTDVELFSGAMAYIQQGLTTFPLRPGHEWTGRVVEVGAAADEHWLGSRVTGDTMLGCGRCERCRSGHHHVCPNRSEVGIRGDQPGALAERIAIPASSAHRIPDHVSTAAAALVEPGGNSWRAVRAAQVQAGGRVLVLGSGTIGLLAALFALAEGGEVHVGGIHPGSLALARTLGVPHVHGVDALLDEDPDRYDAVIEATSGERMPALALRLVKPAGRVVLIGLSSGPSTVDTRDAVLKDVTVVGVLSASPGLAATIDAYASGAVVPDALVGEVVGLHEVPARLEGLRGPTAGPGPKVQVDPRLLP